MAESWGQREGLGFTGVWGGGAVSCPPSLVVRMECCSRGTARALSEVLGLSVYPSISLSVCVLCVPACLSICLSVCLSTSLSRTLSLSLSRTLSHSISFTDCNCTLVPKARP